jgi:hypothetical protein
MTMRAASRRTLGPDRTYTRIAEVGDTHQAVRERSQANGYRLAGPRWEVYRDPDPSSGDFNVEVFWSLVAP